MISYRDIIRRELARLGMSQAELARRAGVHPVALCRWLTGNRASITTATLERLLMALPEPDAEAKGTARPDRAR